MGDTALLDKKMTLFMRKSPLRLFFVALIDLPDCVAHQYGVTRAMAPQQEAGSENQISTHRCMVTLSHLGSECAELCGLT